jgi:hypothetical protein
MSYCMYQNTRLALQQILGDLEEAHEKGVTYEEYVDDFSSSDERRAMNELVDLFEEVQYMINELRDTPAHS